MRKTYLHKSFNLFLILIILSHLSYFHNVLENYIVCYGSDGHVEIENINSNSECSNIDMTRSSSYMGEIIVPNSDCKDVSLSVNCFEDDKIISENKIISSFDIQKNISQVLSFADKQIPTFNYFNSIKIANNILENYTTVSLLI